MDNQYFAAKPTAEMAEVLLEKVRKYFDHLRTNRHIEKIRKCYNMYYGIGEFDSSRVDERGDEGELLEIRVNHLRSILSHILVLTTQNRPGLKAVAINSDSRSQAAARLGDSLLDFYFKTRDLEQTLKDATETALLTGKGYIIAKWDTQEGEEYGRTESGAVIYDGDVSLTHKSCLEVVEDIYAERSNWFIVRELRNRHDLAAQFEEKAELIRSLEPESMDIPTTVNNYDRDDDDLVPHYTFIHRKTPAVPNGRQIEFLEGDILLTDGPLPYHEPLVFEITPAKIRGTQLGYTPAFDLLALNQSLNELYSSILTNQITFAVSNIWVPPGSNVQTSQLSGGLNLIESEVKPEAINFAQTPAEVFKFIEILQGQMETLSGINDVIRGSPQASLKSGSALALVAAQAMAYNSGLQASYSNLLKRVGNALIKLLRDYASTPKVATIVGIANRSMLTQFSGQDLSQIDRVVCEEVSAVSKTTAGRLDLADNLLNSGLLTRPSQYIGLIETGTIDPIMETETSEEQLIQVENEYLRRGEDVIVTALDKHPEHIRGHKQLASDPESRKDPELMARLLDHIQTHLDELRLADPFLLQILREQDIPPPQAPMQGPADGQAPPSGAGMPNMPNMPELPTESPQQTVDAYQQMNAPIPQGEI